MVRQIASTGFHHQSQIGGKRRTIEQRNKNRLTNRVGECKPNALQR
jgi:hypothetical protein